MKQWIARILIAAMVLAMLPAPVWAESACGEPAADPGVSDIQSAEEAAQSGGLTDAGLPAVQEQVPEETGLPAEGTGDAAEAAPQEAVLPGDCIDEAAGPENAPQEAIHPEEDTDEAAGPENAPPEAGSSEDGTDEAAGPETVPPETTLPEEPPLETASPEECRFPWSGLDDRAFYAFLLDPENEALLISVLADDASDAYRDLLDRCDAIVSPELKLDAEARLAELTAAGEPIPEITAPAEETVQSPEISDIHVEAVSAGFIEDPSEDLQPPAEEAAPVEEPSAETPAGLLNSLDNAGSEYIEKRASILISSREGTPECKVLLPSCFTRGASSAQSVSYTSTDPEMTLTVSLDATYWSADQSFSSRGRINPSYHAVSGGFCIFSGRASSSGVTGYIDVAARDISFSIAYSAPAYTEKVQSTLQALCSGIDILVGDASEPADQSTLSSFISRLYSICLKRAPSEAELVYYVTQLSQRVSTGIQTAYGFVFSQEFKNFNLCNDHFIRALYNVFFDRDPTASEKSYWVNLLAGGTKREAVFNGFATSTEYRILCDEAGIRVGDAIAVPARGTVANGSCTSCSAATASPALISAFVSRLYSLCLGRSASEAEISYYTSQLVAKAIVGTETAWCFFASPEFNQKNYSNREYVECLYQVLMDRSAAESEIGYHVNRLVNGARRVDVFNGFAMSNEFRDICSACGIERGSAIQGASDTVVLYRALLIGNTHASSSDPRPANATDARTMQNMLQSMTATPYTCTLRLDRSASQIVSDIAAAFAGATANDVSLFFFSGHGYTGSGSLVGNDGSLLSFASLRAALDRIPGTKIVLLGSCFSGQAINKASGELTTCEVTDADLAAWADAALAAFYEDSSKSGELAANGYYVITACGKDEYSWSISQYGYFSYYLERVCGWNELSNARLSTMSADTNGDKRLTLNEVYTAMESAIRAAGHQQHTRCSPEGSSFVLFGRA